jgi:Kef-type K+ transport system membrane component KefB
MATSVGTGPEQLLVELFAIFVSAKVMGEIFERLSLPSGDIVAGALLGPYAVGWVPDSDTVHSVAELGAIFVLFSAGLETNPTELIRLGGKSATVAVAGIIVPFIMGFGYMKMHGNASNEAVFVGAAMVARV